MICWSPDANGATCPFVLTAMIGAIEDRLRFLMESARHNTLVTLKTKTESWLHDYNGTKFHRKLYLNESIF